MVTAVPASVFEKHSQLIKTVIKAQGLLLLLSEQIPV